MGQRDIPDWFSFYVYEFMGDERVVAMTLEQVGAYILLMIGQWINGSIPSDIPSLGRILKRTDEEMQTLWEGIAPCFKPHPTLPGRMVQARLEAEREVTLERMKTERERQKEIYLRRKRQRGVNAVPTSETHVVCTVLSSLSTKDSKKKEDARTAEFRDTYPAHRLDNLGAQLFCNSSPELQDEILVGLRLWVKSTAWTEAEGKFVNRASNFITEKIYQMKPVVAAVTKPTPYFDPRKAGIID